VDGVRSFASDNASGVHPKVLEAITAANIDHALAYGDDPWTERAVESFRELFGAPVEVLFVWGGTGANVVALQTALRPWSAIVSTDVAHINTDECGAIERFTGCKILDFPRPDGKLRPGDVVAALAGRGDEHHAQASVVSVTQCTELGTVYQPDELGAVTTTAHSHGLRVHMDGARIANAAVSLGADARELVAGVDVLSFGGTKNGMMYGEAVVFFDPELAEHAAFVRKQAAQLPSKTRFVAAQFEALLADDLWLENARNSNAMARRLRDQVADLPGVEIVHAVEANAVFAKVPADVVRAAQEESFFWVFDEPSSTVRWMCSYDTTEADVDAFAELLRKVSEQ
jgi:threonine aldolase